MYLKEKKQWRSETKNETEKKDEKAFGEMDLEVTKNAENQPAKLMEQ